MAAMPLLSPKERTPPKSAGNNAKRGFEARKKAPPSERCCEAEGLARGRQLVNGGPLSESVIKRMYSFFSRHEVDKKGSTWGSKGKGWQAWMLWGGDSAYAWAKSRVAMMERRKKAKKRK